MCAVPAEAEETFDDLNIGIVGNRLALVRDGGKLGENARCNVPDELHPLDVVCLDGLCSEPVEVTIKVKVTL